MGAQPFFEQADIFGVEGQDVHRIPAMVVSSEGTILAFCNRRIGSASDQGHDAHLVLRRSFDDGRSWQPAQVLFAREGWVGGIGNAVVDYVDGTIMIQYTRALTVEGITQREQIEGTKEHLTHAHPDAGNWISRSADGGATWIEERLSLQPNTDGVVLYPHGSGPTMQLRTGRRSGRLIIPAWGWTKPIDDPQQYFRSGVICSDDHGATWHVGGLGEPGTDECCVVERVDGSICLNSRQAFNLGRRGVAWSYDGGETFTDFGWDQTLIEPIPSGCEASMIRYSDVTTGETNRILFANPAAAERVRMTVRVSYDEGKTWPVAKLIHEGPSAYSSLAVTPEGTILCFYERGSDNPYERMTVARFNIEWLES